MIDLNFTLIAAHAATFILLIFVLNMVLYRPIREALAKRKERMAGLASEITSSIERAKSKNEEHEAQLAASRRAGREAREKIVGEGRSAERELIAQATAEMEASVAKVRQQIEAEIGGARDQLRGEIDSFGKELASKVLGRSIQ